MSVGVNLKHVATRRIGVDLPSALLDRVERQAAFLGVDRRYLIQEALRGLVAQFEAIDVECGVACPDCGADTEVDDTERGHSRVCVRCHWSWPEPPSMERV